jgi:hypothetical protein
MIFTGAADSHSGVNIISPRALQRITKANSVKLQYFNCKYKLMVANKDTVEVTQEVTIPFQLTDLSTQEYQTRFLIMETPFDIILSHDTLTKTGLGNHIYRDCKPPPRVNATYDLHQPDTNEDTDFADIMAHLDLSNDTVLSSLMSIINSDPDLDFDAMNDFPDPYPEKICEQAIYDPPNIHAQGEFGRKLHAMSEQYSSNVYRGALPPEPARVPPFEIHFSAAAPPLKYEPPRRLSPKLLAVLKETCIDLLKQRIITRSAAAYAAPVVMAVQKDKIRTCIDYRRVNQATTKMRFPLPNPANIFPNLAGKKYFGSMDLRSGYHQLAMSEASSPWTAFVTPDSQYRFLRVPFGLANAPAWFQRAMSELVLAGLIGIVGHVFVDDIIIYGNSEEEFLINYQKVLDRLKEFNIVLKGPKCHLGCTEVSFLGYIADAEGLRHDPKRTEQLLAIPFPETKKALRSFLGLGNFFRGFVRHYAAISKPLTSIINAGTGTAVSWTNEARQAFSDLKQAISVTVKTFYVDYSHDIYLHTDASQLGLGGVLFQVINGQFRPVQFVSKALTTTESRWEVQEQEAYAIIYCIKKLDHYLRGSHFIVHTDHRNLVYIRNSQSAKITRWSMLLQEFDFTLSVIAGKDNLIADVLSRIYPADAKKFQLERISDDILGYVDHLSLNRTYDHESPPHSHLAPKVESESLEYPTTPPSSDESPSTIDVSILPDLSILPDFPFRSIAATPASDCPPPIPLMTLTQPSPLGPDVQQSRAARPPVIIPFADAEQLATIRQFHNHLFGHHGIDQTLKLLRLHGHTWTGIKSHVVNYIQTCPHCQKNKSRNPVAIPEHTTTEVYEPFVSVAIDTLGPFPTSPQGHKYVFVIVCCFSSFTELIPSFDNTAIAAAHALLQIFGRYGATFYLRSDNAPNFAGHVMKHFRSLLDISEDFTIPYRPASNGIVERKNREVLAHLRALLFTDNLVKLNWHYLLPIAQRICNATDVASLGCSPAQLIFGNSIHLNRGLDTAFQPIIPTSQRVSEYIKTLCDGQTALIRASQKHLAHIKDVYLARTPQPSQSYPPGSYVLIAYPTDFRPKMANQLRGPFRVISSFNSTYQVQSFTDPDRLISIHCSRLRQFYAEESYHISPVESAATDDQEFAIDYISDHTGSPTDPTDMTFLVHWLGFDEKESDWQSFDSISESSALDSYILEQLPSHPMLALLIQREDREFVSTINIDNALHYQFRFLDQIVTIPPQVVLLMPDHRAIHQSILTKPTSRAPPPPIARPTAVPTEQAQPQHSVSSRILRSARR